MFVTTALRTVEVVRPILETQRCYHADMMFPNFCEGRSECS